MFCLFGANTCPDGWVNTVNLHFHNNRTDSVTDQIKTSELRYLQFQLTNVVFVMMSQRLTSFYNACLEINFGRMFKKDKLICVPDLMKI